MKYILSPPGEKVTGFSPNWRRVGPRISRTSHNYSSNYDNHTNCEQARYMRRQNNRMSYSEAVTQGGPTHRTYKGGNIYNNLN